jgi:glycosyltransferase involved in cell wall biosynthesis
MPPSDLRAVHVTISGLARYGGPARAVPALAAALLAEGTDAHLVLPDPPGSDARVPVDARLPVTRVGGRFDAEGVPVALPSLPAVLDALVVPGRTVLHDHGMWRPTGRACASAAARHRVPLVVSPRGMLTRDALSARRWRKTVALALWGRRDLARAAVLHCTSVAEADDLMRLRLGVPLAVIPTGLSLPPAAAPHNEVASERCCVFIGRLAPIKGLGALVDAWARLKPAGWRLVFVGPDERGERGRLEARVRALGVGDRVQCVGPVDDAAKWAWLARADLAVLPSVRESFGLFVGEALAAGVPVVATTGVPWPALDAQQCGWHVAPANLAEALAEATSVPAAVRRAMGARGRALVAAEYAWHTVATATRAVYDWTLGRAPRPPVIVAP